MSIGRGPLPSANDAEFDAWLVPSQGGSPEAFYKRHGSPGSYTWLRQNSRIHNDTDPLKVGETVVPLSSITDRVTVVEQRVIDDASLRWQSGFAGIRTWVLSETGVPTEYHLASGATLQEGGATVPGTNGAVWALNEAVSTALVTYRNARDN